MESWNEIRKWRRAERARLLSRRLAVPRVDKYRTRSVLAEMICERLPELSAATIGFYWPIKGEIDLRHLVRHFLDGGADAALPVVVEKGRPLEFWAWHPRMKLDRGLWNIPVPSERTVVRPTVLLVPLLGHDGAGYRLGYGGGYYDRTLAAMRPRPLTIGVGYALGRLETIHPQPHDIPMDAIVTEDGFLWSSDPADRTADFGAILDEDPNSGTAYASPPCFMHELGAAYLGYMDKAEALTLLNDLLEAERAGARGVAEMAKVTSDPAPRAELRAIAKDEAHFCAMLSRHIKRLQGVPSRATGPFFGKLLARGSLPDRIDFLARGQGWVVKRLQEALPRIGDESLRADLRDMLEVHQRNIGRCLGLVL